MPLPPALLERLKKRKIIQVSTSSSEDPTVHSNSINSAESRYGNDDLTRSESNLEEEQEEIIAEDYSDESEAQDNQHDESDHSEESENEDEGSHESNSDDNDGDGDKISRTQSDLECDNQNLQGRLRPSESVLGCPHKYNVYHECSQYCVDKYSKPESIEPNLEQRKQLALILRTFPMTNEWTVVYDPGIRTFYFWNIVSNLVSWFPPGMSTFASPSADHIRNSLKETQLQDLE